MGPDGLGRVALFLQKVEGPATGGKQQHNDQELGTSQEGWATFFPVSG